MLDKNTRKELYNLGFTKVIDPKVKIEHKKGDLGYHNWTDLSQCYGKCSQRKKSAFNWCKEFCDELNGFDFHISSRNFNMFTVTFYFEFKGFMCCACITRTNNYCTICEVIV